MRKTILIMVAAAVALVASAVAYAAFTASGVSAATATFSTDKVVAASHRLLHRRRRQGIHGHERPLHRRGRLPHAGAAAELNGPLTIDARTVYSTTDGLGYVTGSFHVKNDRPASAQRPLHGHAQGNPARRLPRRRRHVGATPGCSAT